MAMFGLIVAGRLVSTTWEQISPTNVVSEIADAEAVNHLVVFLTGTHHHPMSSNIPASHVQELNPSLTVWAELCISAGLLPLGENRSGSSWAPFTTTNLPLYSG